MTAEPVPLHGRVVSASRRYARIVDAAGVVLDAITSSRHLDLLAGDHVTYRVQQGEAFVESVEPRRNCFARHYRDKRKDIAANLDHLFIIAAVEPLFNKAFIDRILTIASFEEIPVTLLVNKIDLDVTSTLRRIEIYRNLNFKTILMSAKSGEGFADLTAVLASDTIQCCALTGVSGVGKSTVLNRLIPEAERRTAEVSKRTGQGKQTTTLAAGHVYQRQAAQPVVIIDLPGMQSIGVAHISQEHLGGTFPEFAALRSKCKYSDCAHEGETECAVKDAVSAGALAVSRYESYLAMLVEIKESRRY